MNDIGKRLIELRKNKKLSQQKLGENLGLSRSHICNIEKGTRTLNEQTILSICSIYNVNKDWLVNGVGEMYKNELDKYDINDPSIKKFMTLYLKSDKATQEYVLKVIEKKLELEDKLKRK